ncbi:MAG TPA: sulfotransferase domain-containing protein [Solirubrobacterales bacterium]|nr:sulfotransferase domain-containing protein [Solirubrobacterales bacterium]
MSKAIEIGRGYLGRGRRSGEHALRRASAADRPLPDFLVIGAQKAGTTSLLSYLCQHPAVRPPVRKEVHFLDHEFERGPSWYRAHFARRRPGTVTGEATPYYLFHPLAARRAAAVVPGARLVVLLRDPIDRAFSQHNHERVLGFETLPFEAALAAEAERLAGEEERILAEPRYRSFCHQHHSYLARGRYVGQLQRWLECFDRDRVLVLAAEDLFADPRGVVLQTQEFLGLEPLPPSDTSPRNARSYAPIEPALRERLTAGFAAENRRLYELVGREFAWG